MVDTQKLARTVAFLRANPQRHDQCDWICGSTACFAGWQWILDNFTEDQWSTAPDLEELGDYDVTDLERSAQASLGLTHGEADALFRATIAHSVPSGGLLNCGATDSYGNARLVCPVGPTPEARALRLAGALIARDTDTLDPDSRAVLEHYELSTEAAL